MNNFIIYPAIDLRNGLVVRLMQGDPSRQTVFSSDPAGIAHQWAAEGAQWLHVVNLDGALGERTTSNREALREILAVCGHRVKIQFGGGLRDLRQIASILEAGVSRVVVGTAILEDPAFAKQASRKFGAQLAFALDVGKGRLRSHGWQKASTQSAMEFAEYLASRGAATLIYTDINRDGMGTGLDWLTAKELGERSGLKIIASGGVASLADVVAAKAAGLSGVIIGRALYEKRFTFSEALSC